MSLTFTNPQAILLTVTHYRHESSPTVDFAPIAEQWKGWLNGELAADDAPTLPAPTTQYRGQAQGGIPLKLAVHPERDAYLTRVTLYPTSPITPFAPQQWALYRDRLTELLRQIDPPPQGVSWLFFAEVPEDTETDGYEALVQRADGLQLSTRQAQNKYRTDHYGWLWLYQHDLSDARVDGVDTFQQTDHRFVLLSKPRPARLADANFLQPFQQGWSRLAYYQHKACFHQWRYDKQIGPAFRAANEKLRQGIRQARQTDDPNQIEQERQELESLAERMIEFATRRDAAQHLQYSLQANLDSFNINLERVNIRADDSPYQTVIEEVNDTLEAMEHDLKYATFTHENAQLIVAAQRETITMRLEHAGLLLGIAAAILTLVSVFDGFLEIWSFLSEKTTPHFPNSWVRFVSAFLVTLSSALLLFGLGLPLNMGIPSKLNQWLQQHRSWVVGAAGVCFVLGVGLAVVMSMAW